MKREKINYYNKGDEDTEFEGIDFDDLPRELRHKDIEDKHIKKKRGKERKENYYGR